MVHATTRLALGALTFGVQLLFWKPGRQRLCDWMICVGWMTDGFQLQRCTTDSDVLRVFADDADEVCEGDAVVLNGADVDGSSRRGRSGRLSKRCGLQLQRSGHGL